MVDNEKILAGMEVLNEFKDKLTALCEEYRGKVQAVCPEDIRTQCGINKNTNLENLFELQFIGNRGYNSESSKEELEANGFVFQLKYDEDVFTKRMSMVLESFTVFAWRRYKMKRKALTVIFLMTVISLFYITGSLDQGYITEGQAFVAFAVNFAAIAVSGYKSGMLTIDK